MRRMEAEQLGLLEAAKRESKIEGLEECVQVFEMLQPNLNLDVIHQLVKLYKGEINEDEAFPKFLKALRLSKIPSRCLLCPLPKKISSILHLRPFLTRKCMALPFPF